MTTMSEDIARLSEMAVTVGLEYEEMENAIKAERAEKAKILHAIVDAGAPALRALGSRVLVGEDGAAGRHDPTERYWLRGTHGRGLLVAEERAQSDGGRSLYLSEQGAFLELHYRRMAGPEGWAWRATETLLPSAMQVVEARWSVADVVDAVYEAMTGHLRGKNQKRIAAVEENVEKLRAVAVLIRGIERAWR
jgi:hypothetical protein